MEDKREQPDETVGEPAAEDQSDDTEGHRGGWQATPETKIPGSESPTAGDDADDTEGHRGGWQ